MVWLAGVAAGPIAALAYPGLRKLSAELLRGDQAVCLEVLGLCGGVPAALQDFFKSTVGLLFSFLLGYTFYTLLARQETLYNALFEETAVLTQLLEEAQLFLPHETVLRLVRCVRRYLSPAWANPKLLQPAEVSARILRHDRDAVEEMSRILIRGGAGNPAYKEVLGSVRALRVARARRLAAMQRTIPPVQFNILALLALLAALPPFLEGSGESSTLSQVLYGILVSVLVLVLAAVEDVADPSSIGAYSTVSVRAIILAALEDAIASIEAGATLDEKPIPEGQEGHDEPPGY